MHPASAPTRPLLKPWYRVAHADDRILLEHGDSVISLEGGATRELLPALLRLLDGTRTQPEILAQLGEPVAPAAEHAIGELVRCGAVTEGPPMSSSTPQLETASFLAASDGNRGPHELLAGLDPRRVAVVGEGAQADEIAHLLGLSLRGRLDRVMTDVAAEAIASVDLAIAAPSAAEPAALEQMNAVALTTGTPWLQILPFDGRHAAIGPVFVPGDTCCRSCYLLRRASLSGYPADFEVLARTPSARAVPPAVSATIGGLACLVALRWLVDRDALLAGVCHALELRPELTVTPHVVYRVPRCPDCSTVVADPLPWFEEDT